MAEPPPLTRSEASRLLDHGPATDLALAVIAVALGEDCPEFAMAYALRCTSHPDEVVRGNAILCLGHIARIHGQVPSSTVELVTGALVDSSSNVRGHAAFRRPRSP